jgi:hypothetical protein
MTDRAKGNDRPAAGRRGPDWGRRARAWIVWFVCLNAIWLVLISAFVLEETLLGILASAVAATAAVAVGEQRPLSFRPRPRWLLASWRLPVAAVRESGQVVASLPRQLAHPGRGRGRFRVVRVSFPDDPDRAATKAALLIAGDSFSPNSYVVKVDRERGLMLVHELVSGEER